MIIRMIDLEWGETLGDRLEAVVAAKLCERDGHQIVSGPEGAHESAWCERCGMGLLDHIVF